MTKDQSYREMEYGTFDKATETERTSNIEKKREIFIEELNVLNHDKCPVRELAFFNKNPLLQRIITFLQECTLRVDTALFLETTILLAHYDISAEPLIGCINHFYCSRIMCRKIPIRCPLLTVACLMGFLNC